MSATVVPDRDRQSRDLRGRVLQDLAAVRDALLDPDGLDPAVSRRPSSGPDALELNAACLALPSYAREVGIAGTPLLWTWPHQTYPQGLERREELLQAAALLLTAIERLDANSTSLSPGRALRVVGTGKGDVQ